MGETDFSREHAERAEAQGFELEKMRERSALALTRARLQLIALFRQRAFMLCLLSDPYVMAIIASRKRRSRRA